LDVTDFDDYWVQSPKAQPNLTPQELRFDKIEGVKPLGSQFGVTEPETVPNILYNSLFGQAGATTLHTYVILDAAKFPDLPELLENSGLPHLCLFKGDTYDELKEVAPWIVQIEAGNSFTRSLFTRSTSCRWCGAPRRAA